VETNNILKTLFEFSGIFGIKTSQDFLFILGVTVFLLLFISLLFKAFTTWFQLRFITMIQHDLGKQLIKGFLNQPYIWFLNRHSADLAKIIFSQINEVNSKAIKPMFQIISQTLVTITLVTLLIIVNPKISLIIFLTFFFTYLILFKVIKRRLKRIGNEQLISDRMRFESVTEAFGAIKELKLSRLENVFIKRFSDPAKIFAKHTVNALLLGQLPRYLIEIIAFGGILLITLYFVSQNNNFATSIPLISLYAFAGYRLMPSIQIIYFSVTQLKFAGPSVDVLYHEIKNLKQPLIYQENNEVVFKNIISLKNIHFHYPYASKKILKNINLEVKINTTVGIVGATGSGKTTLVDIILGLLPSQNGVLKIDNNIITNNNVRAWQRQVGYVPQSIFLTDDTIAANIGFGIEKKDINQDNLVKAAKLAKIHEFISQDLSKKYETVIGERGVRLSGGQRQRIGIARALYHQPKLLIFDEATSALDNQTEVSIMETLKNLKDNVTIILIAHRLSTVKKCDQIFLLEKGQLKNQGTFDELINIDENFKISVNK